MSDLEAILTWTQFAVLAALAVLGFHRGWLVARARALRRRGTPPGGAPPGDWPAVTVQLPIYNERYVAARLVDAVSRLDYPRDRLQIQVLDDSTDDTTAAVQRAIAAAPADLCIEHERRGSREGYKAGALACGLESARGELIAVFDADFVPPPDFLRAVVPAFADPRVGMAQARWEHLNEDFSLLTRMQATLLDGHFAVEHLARARSGRFFNFNGTAGVFRARCIEDAGGWQFDTLTEDLDLSYRAQLRGWKFVYLPDVTCPAELPVDMAAFLNQQHRWAKGAVQTARKVLGPVLRGAIPWRTKLEALFHLLGNAAFPLLLVLIFVSLPLQVARHAGDGAVHGVIHAAEAAVLLLSTLCVLVYYGAAQAWVGRFCRSSPWRLPLVVALGAGLAVNNTAAILGGLRRATGEFRRTPKHDAVGKTSRAVQLGRFAYRSPRGSLPVLELGLGLWALATAGLALPLGLVSTTVFHGLFGTGLLWVGTRSLALTSRTSDQAPAAAAQPSP